MTLSMFERSAIDWPTALSPRKASCAAQVLPVLHVRSARLPFDHRRLEEAMSGGQWNHAQCVACWNRDNPDNLVNARRAQDIVRRESLTCCFCGALTWAGIFVREDPAKLGCRGQHQEEDVQ